MKEYFVKGNSFAAPFVSDTLKGFIKGNTPKEALTKFIDKCTHPCGVYSANIYASANHYEKGKKPLSRYLCNLALKIKEIDGTFLLNKGNGVIEIDHIEYTVEKWNEGKII